MRSYCLKNCNWKFYLWFPLDAHDPLEVACKRPLRPKELPLALLTVSKLFLFVLPPLTEEDDMFDGSVLLWRAGSITKIRDT